MNSNAEIDAILRRQENEVTESTLASVAARPGSPPSVAEEVAAMTFKALNRPPPPQAQPA
jgi:hypothetical protein